MLFNLNFFIYHENVEEVVQKITLCNIQKEIGIFGIRARENPMRFIYCGGETSSIVNNTFEFLTVRCVCNIVISSCVYNRFGWLQNQHRSDYYVIILYILLIFWDKFEKCDGEENEYLMRVLCNNVNEWFCCSGDKLISYTEIYKIRLEHFECAFFVYCVENRRFCCCN